MSVSPRAHAAAGGRNARDRSTNQSSATRAAKSAETTSASVPDPIGRAPIVRLRGRAPSASTLGLLDGGEDASSPRALRPNTYSTYAKVRDGARGVVSRPCGGPAGHGSDVAHLRELRRDRGATLDPLDELEQVRGRVGLAKDPHDEPLVGLEVALRHVAPRDDNDFRREAQRAHRVEDLLAGYVGEHEVEEDEVGAPLVHVGERPHPAVARAPVPPAP